MMTNGYVGPPADPAPGSFCTMRTFAHWEGSINPAAIAVNEPRRPYPGAAEGPFVYGLNPEELVPNADGEVAADHWGNCGVPPGALGAKSASYSEVMQNAVMGHWVWADPQLGVGQGCDENGENCAVEDGCKAAYHWKPATRYPGGTWHLGADGESCDDTCAAVGKRCVTEPRVHLPESVVKGGPLNNYDLARWAVAPETMKTMLAEAGHPDCGLSVAEGGDCLPTNEIYDEADTSDNFYPAYVKSSPAVTIGSANHNFGGNLGPAAGCVGPARSRSCGQKRRAWRRRRRMRRVCARRSDGEKYPEACPVYEGEKHGQGHMMMLAEANAYRGDKNTTRFGFRARSGPSTGRRMN